MPTLLWSSPRSSLSPAPAGGSHRGESHPDSSISSSTIRSHYHMHPHPAHRVAFGASAVSSNLNGFGGPHHHQPPASPSPSPFASISSSNNSAGPAAGLVSPPPSTAAQASSSSSSSNAFGFGFGYSAPAGPSSSSSSSSLGFGVHSPFKPPHASTSSNGAIPLPSSHGSPGSNRRRRRRSDSPRDQMMQDDEHEDATAGKRLRREIRGIRGMNGSLTLSNNTNPNSGETSSNANASPASPANDVDIGKALASLSKSDLLSLMTSLLTNQPSLKPLVLSLLPPPSLEAFTTNLRAHERKVLDALPTGTGLRDEYVWSRIRTPLEEYVSEARLALGQFCTNPSTSTTGLDDLQHPTTIFAFLGTLTQSIRKLEVLLPRAPLPFGSTSSSSSSSQPSINNPSTLNPRDPLMSFLPALFNQWHLLITRLSNVVNQNGSIMSAEMLRNWFRTLDALVSMSSAVSTSYPTGVNYQEKDSNAVGRKATESIRDRFVKELGWLIGVKPSTSVPSPPQSQISARTASGASSHDGQAIQAVANQMMDSRMMMMDGDRDESDEEL